MCCPKGQHELFRRESARSCHPIEVRSMYGIYLNPLYHAISDVGMQIDTVNFDEDGRKPNKNDLKAKMYTTIDGYPDLSGLNLTFSYSVLILLSSTFMASERALGIALGKHRNVPWIRLGRITRSAWRIKRMSRSSWRL